jgi:hypothetical protein
MSFILKKTYLDNSVGYFSEELPFAWKTSHDPIDAHQFKTLKAAPKLLSRWDADNRRRAIETQDGRERCKVEIVEVHAGEAAACA